MYPPYFEYWFYLFQDGISITNMIPVRKESNITMIRDIFKNRNIIFPLFYTFNLRDSGLKHSSTTNLPEMHIKFYAPLWGNSLPFEEFCKNVKTAGYDGVEMELPWNAVEKDNLLDILKDHHLELIGQYYQSFEADPVDNVKSYERYLRHLMAAQPVLINCQTGKDFFDFEDNLRHFKVAKELSDSSGIPITHETHRGKCLYSAPIAKNFFQRLPDLRICLDISHWCNVHESLLEDQKEAMELAISRTDHIHSRVGHPEGPQVNDPRAPEWSAALQAHLDWWDSVVQRHRKEESTLRITTEFGPFPYMPTVPYTQVPIANQWNINVYMMNLLKKRYLR